MRTPTSSDDFKAMQNRVAAGRMLNRALPQNEAPDVLIKKQGRVPHTELIIEKHNENKLHLPIIIKVKPLSVNACWKGRRYKTDDYKFYESAVMCLLPSISMPKPPFKLTICFGLSTVSNDIDNGCKPLIDILQKRYGFNDRYINELHVFKNKVEKGQEYFSFYIENILK